MPENPCAHCGEPCPTQPYQGNPRKWCSRTCSDRARRIHTCTDCGREFSGTAENCRPCRRKAAEDRRATRPPKARTWTPLERECPICHVVFLQDAHNQIYCTATCRDSRRNWGTKVASATERGYGREHRDERARWKPLVDSGQVDCCLCGRWIEPGTQWHLDHTEDRTGYRGAAHASCNVKDGASRGARRTNAQRRIEKTCATCQRPFVTPYPKQRYCTRECRPKPEGKRVGHQCKVTFAQCATCDELFTSHNGRKYCDEDCAYLAQLVERVVKDCEGCGNPMVGYEGRRYCSSKCSPRHKTQRKASKARAKARRQAERHRIAQGSGARWCPQHERWECATKAHHSCPPLGEPDCRRCAAEGVGRVPVDRAA